MSTGYLLTDTGNASRLVTWPGHQLASRTQRAADQIVSAA